jgi:predicted methyltransferase
MREHCISHRIAGRPGLAGCALTLVTLAALFLGAVLPARAADAALQAAIANPKRTPAFVQRDAARHPLEELEFFGVRPAMTLVEIDPGGGYWTEILAPYLKEAGTYYAAVPSPNDPDAPKPGKDRFRAKIAADPQVYGKILLTELGPGHYDVAPAGTADLILTFRNLHNWMAAGYAPEALQGFYRALKPGGVLGIEDHRGSNDVRQDPSAYSGYVRQDYAIELARKAGFEFVGASEINANPRDTKDWPEGVWTLPPTLTLKDKDRAKYIAIGEADNFVLKFRKPGP